jgi:CRISPR-associated protein Cmr5
MQTMQQKRAKHALTAVRAAAHDPRLDKDEYKSHAAALPAMIHINGLGQAAAFYRSKGGAHGRLYQLLSDWLTGKAQPYAACDDLLQGIVEGDMHSYRLAQAEAQALMDWVVKFAKAYLGGEDKP